jgi:hypothetical protein
MTSIAAGDGAEFGPAAENQGRRRAAGIYGAIITAAILDTAGGHVSTAALVVSVVVTLLVYWVAEEYAEVLGEQAAGGRLPSRASIQGALISTWPMVTASYLPLLAVVLAAAFGGVEADRRQRRPCGGGRAVDSARVAGWAGGPVAGPETAGRHLHRGGAGPGDDLAEGPGAAHLH